MLHDGQATPVASGYGRLPSVGGTVEVGYAVEPAFQGRGHGTELVAALMAHTLYFTAVLRVIAHARPDNRAANKAARQVPFSAAELRAILAHVPTPARPDASYARYC